MKPIQMALSVILALLAAPFASEAQQPTKIYRIGYLAGTTEGCWRAFVPRKKQIETNARVERKTWEVDILIIA